MAGLVEKVKQSIRNRSRSRKSISGSDFGDSRQSIDDSRRSGTFHDGRQSGQYTDERVGRSGQAVPPSAYKPVSTESAANNSSIVDSEADTTGLGRAAVSRKPVSNVVGETGRHTSDPNGSTGLGGVGNETVPPISTSSNSSNTYNNQSSTMNPSKLRQSVDGERGVNDRMDGMSLGSGINRNQQSIGSVGVSDSIRNRNTTTREEVPPVPSMTSGHHHSGAQTMRQEAGKIEDAVHEHMRLPDGFHRGRTEQTEVTTQWKPAVTQETVLRQRTEILQEAITRDIHVHHYYTYTQPVKVVEVLPAKHYHLDHKTGIKTEIQAPVGWTLPEDMQIRQHNTAPVKAMTRHYLVDEEHPRGVLEAPPVHHKHGQEQIQSNNGAGRQTQDGGFRATQPLEGYSEERVYHHDNEQPMGRAI